MRLDVFRAPRLHGQPRTRLPRAAFADQVDRLLVPIRHAHVFDALHDGLVGFHGVVSLERSMAAHKLVR